MKSMKKFVAALLVLTMVLALTGSAFAGDCIKAGKWVKFTKNSYAYKAAKSSKKVTGPEVIVRKGSKALVREVKNGYAYVQLSYPYPNKDMGNDYDVVEEGGKKVKYYFWAYWFKTSTLALVVKEKNYGWDVIYSNGGNGKSKCYVDEDGKIIAFKDEGTWEDKATEYDYWEIGEVRISKDCMKHVEATSKVWMHKTPSLSNSYGKALRKGDKVTYRRKWSFDTRGVKFLGIRYKGKCLWVSKAYTKFVK